VDAAAAAEGVHRQALHTAAYDIVWPIVFAGMTRGIELGRGHLNCAVGVHRLADQCLDRFHDDVEAVVNHLLTRARTPIVDLEAWVAGRLTAATVDGHRRRRGLRGALQRPRLPGWLAAELGHDRWLTTLATQVLVWVGVTTTAGHQVWPCEAWAQQRATCTGDWLRSDPETVAREVHIVLTAMRRRPDWYERYVERPLGGKQAPVAPLPMEEMQGEAALPLSLDDPYAQIEAEMQRLAADAVASIDSRLDSGEDTSTVVVEVIRGVFGGALTGTLELAPYRVTDPLGDVTGALADSATVDRIVATVRAIISERDD
jgi:hypothetical protein